MTADTEVRFSHLKAMALSPAFDGIGDEPLALSIDGEEVEL